MNNFIDQCISNHGKLKVALRNMEDAGCFENMPRPSMIQLYHKIHAVKKGVVEGDKLVAGPGGEEGGEVQLQQVQVHAVHFLLRVVEVIVEGLEGLKVEEVEEQHRQAEAVHLLLLVGWLMMVVKG